MGIGWRHHKLIFMKRIFYFFISILFAVQSVSAQQYGIIASSIQLGGGGSNPGILDTITGAIPGYSLRHLLAAYTGDCLQVRRASDNTTQNIGFVADTLDTGSINTFCSGTTCYVRIWYDQSGNGLDAVGANEATNNDALPIIYESGSVTKCNARVAIKFTHPRRFQWSTSSFDLADIVTGGAASSDKKATVSMVGLIGSSATNPLISYFEDNVDQSEIWQYYDDGSSVRLEFIGTAAALSGYTDYTRDAQKMFFGQVDGADFQGWENTSLIGTATNSSVQQTTNTGLTILLGGHAFSGRNIEGFMQELIFWDYVVNPNDLFASCDAFWIIP